MVIGTTKNESPLTKEFLEKILKRKVASFKCEEGSNPGDNFLSILFSLEIRLVEENEPLHLLFKTFPHHPTRQKLLNDTNIFLKEYLVYDVWIPELIKFQKDVVGNPTILRPAVPTLVAGNAIDYSNIGEVNLEVNPMLANFILMVDERKKGFQMANKLLSLGYHHVKVVLDELAKLHAMGYAYKVHAGVSNVQQLFPFLEDPVFSSETLTPTLDAMFEINRKVITETLRGFLDDRPEIEERLLLLLKESGAGTKIMKKYLNPDGVNEVEVENLQRVKRYSGEPFEDQWIVPGHGDCWTNNMLFRTDDTGKVTDAILVDLQIARECCIMSDLIYFFYTSTDTDFRGKYLQEMLEWYHGKFIDYCKTLKVEPFYGFTIQNFKRKFHRSKLLGLVFAFLVTPIILIRTESSVDLDTVEVEVTGDGDGSEDAFSTMINQSKRDEDDQKLLRERFTALLAEMYDEGVL